MATGVDVGTRAPAGATRVIAVVQLGIGAFLALAYLVVVGPTLVEVWTDDTADVAFGQFFFTATVW